MYNKVISKEMKLNILTWNILADSYIRGQPSINNAINDKYHQNSQDWNYRYPLIHKCLTYSNADIYCLQEVDHYSESFQSYFQNINYESIYLQRPYKKDGCLIAYNKDLFKLIYKSELDFDKQYNNNENNKKFLKQNVALFLKLKCLTTHREFIVCTTHLHWNPNLSDVKISQLLQILTHLSTLCIENEDINHQNIPIILTGDFNILPIDSIYHILTNKNNINNFNNKLKNNSIQYYGPKTRFLCDTSLIKLCKWMRSLGINIAMDSWDSGSSYIRNKIKLNRLDINTSSKDILLLEKDSYVIRKSSINAFFERAKLEKRVILTTSKSLRDRSTCPYSYYVDPINLKLALVNIFKDFGLELSKEQLLTVCGKCGDEVELIVDSSTDVRLQGKWIPNDREVFACINCAQPYWWNEKADSLPAQAMKRAEDLYHTLTISLTSTPQQTCDSSNNNNNNINSITTTSNTTSTTITTTNNNINSITTTSNTTSTTITTTTNNNNNIDVINNVNHNLSHIDNNNNLQNSDTCTLEKLMESFELRNKRIINQKSIHNDDNTINNNGIIIKESINENNINEIHSCNITNNNNDDDKDVTAATITTTSNTNSNSNNNNQISNNNSNNTNNNDTTATTTTSNKGEVILNSVFSVQGKSEPILTNWNRDFKGTLDYIFISNQWKVLETLVYPQIEGNNMTKCDDINAPTKDTTINNDKDHNSIANKDNKENPLLNYINASQPSVLWPSDHFIVQTTVILS